MRIYKILLNVVFVLTIVTACQTGSKTDADVTYQCPMKCEGEQTFDHAGSCSVCKMDLKPISLPSAKSIEEISETSIFNLTSTWHTEEGKVIQLKELKGKTLVMVMIYTSCKAACPRLVADMRNIERQLPKENLNNVQFVLVSIDPETDTPERLKRFAIENKMDGEQWTFLQGNPNSVRGFANVLAVKYKEISPIDFSHSNIISVFNSEGELMHQQEGLGVDNAETVAKIIEVSK
ncbi:MAG: SCO family protein [Flavobacteriaceae bacterium]